MAGNHRLGCQRGQTIENVADWIGFNVPALSNAEQAGHDRKERRDKEAVALRDRPLQDAIRGMRERREQGRPLRRTGIRGLDG